MKKVLLIGTSVLLAQPSFSQTTSEALIYSRYNLQATARSMGFGNALGSIGGDMATLSVNPAGIGVYRSSELVFTPALKFGSTSGYYQGNNTNDKHLSFGLNNLGIVATRNYSGTNKSWKTFSFAFGVNRLADFKRSATYTGVNTESSQSELFAYDANTFYNEFAADGNFDNRSPAFLGYNSYLIDTFGVGGQFISLVDYTSGIQQRKTISEKGGLSEMIFSFGGNYQEKLLLGATIGIPIVTYRSETQFTEQDLSTTINSFSDYTHSETLKTNGIGINAKLGAIFIPNVNWRIGVAVHTPSLINFSETFDARLRANTENFGGVQEAVAQTSEFEYNYVSPFRALVSASVLVGKRGFITADYEFVDYSKAKFQLNTFANEEAFGAGAFTDWQSSLNNDIRKTYKAASHLRLGGEVRWEEFMFRAGAGWSASPFRKQETFNTARVDISGGIGYRGNRTFVDVGYMHSSYQQPDVAYTIPYTNGPVTAPQAKLEYGLNNIALTVGFKF